MLPFGQRFLASPRNDRDEGFRKNRNRVTITSNCHTKSPQLSYWSFSWRIFLRLSRRIYLTLIGYCPSCKDSSLRFGMTERRVLEYPHLSSWTLVKDLSEALPKNFFCHFLVIALRAKIPYWLMGCPQVVILNEVKDLSKALAEEFILHCFSYWPLGKDSSLRHGMTERRVLEYPPIVILNTHHLSSWTIVKDLSEASPKNFFALL